jgi:hypothetical protein
VSPPAWLQDLQHTQFTQTSCQRMEETMMANCPLVVQADNGRDQPILLSAGGRLHRQLIIRSTPCKCSVLDFALLHVHRQWQPVSQSSTRAQTSLLGTHTVPRSTVHLVPGLKAAQCQSSLSGPWTGCVATLCAPCHGAHPGELL